MSMAHILAKDTLAGTDGQILATINGQVKVLAEIKSIEATIDFQKTEVKAIGSKSTQYKKTGWTGSGTVDYYFSTSEWASIIDNYVNKGIDTYFTIVATIIDPANPVLGAHTVKMSDCNISSGDVFKLTADDELLEGSFEFTFSGYEVLTQFTPLARVNAVVGS